MNDKHKNVGTYPIIGRNSHIDLSKYLVRVHGRNVIDYEKLKVNEPELYEQILVNERKENCQNNIEIEKILSD